jgi:ABC-type antimicrobial peptide transport system permease subunit
MRLTLIGLGIGLGLAIPLGFAIRSQLYQTSPLDPTALGGTIALLLLAALVACLVPALRVITIQPMESLRPE